MYTIQQTETFRLWLDDIKDNVTRIRLARRLERVSRGLLGDVKALGDGVFEMREAFGPGWRMYYVERAGQLIILLGGGDKSTQSHDIKQAKQLAAEV